MESRVSSLEEVLGFIEFIREDEIKSSCSRLEISDDFLGLGEHLKDV